MSRTSAFVLAWIACIGALALGSARAHAICRVVEPQSGPGLAFDATTNVLWALAPDQVLDYRCEGGETPVWIDPAAPPDTSGDAGATGSPGDAGATGSPGDAGSLDPSVPYCAGAVPATPVRGTLVSMVLQPLVAGGQGTAGLVMPVPSRPDVRTAPSTLFRSTLESVMGSSPAEVTEYVQDPSFGWQCYDPHVYSRAEPPRVRPPVRGPAALALAMLAGPLSATGCGDVGAEGYYRPGTDGRPTRSFESDAGTVRWESFPEIDGYEVSVLNASSLDALAEWLDLNGFAHDADDDTAFATYVRTGGWFVAVKVTAGSYAGGTRALAPLAVTFPHDRIPITNELQYDPIGGVIVTEAFVLAPHRMTVADGSAEAQFAVQTVMPSDASGFGLASGWVTRLSITRRMFERKPDSAIVAARDTVLAPEAVTHVTRVHIPVACTPENGFESNGCGASQPTAARTYATLRFPGPPSSDYLQGWTTTTVPTDCAGRGPAGSYGSDGSGFGYACAVSAGSREGGSGLLGLASAILGGVFARRRRRRAERTGGRD